MVVTVEAGVTLEQLNQELGKAGQHLPLDPMGGPGHTIGGLLATGLSGPLRLRYGSARDNLIFHADLFDVPRSIRQYLPSKVTSSSLRQKE